MQITKSDIREMLLTSDRALARGIVAIYRRQTPGERGAKATMEDNGRGFNASDARTFSLMAELLLAGGALTVEQKLAARERLPKYAGQLLEVAMAKTFGL